MNVFITGGSGWIGGEVTRQLVSAGHTVTGLARSDEAAARVVAAGASVLRGDLDDGDALAQGARAADGVIHCAFIHDFNNYQKAAVADRFAIETMGTVLANTGKLMLVTSGTAGFAPGRPSTEEDLPRPGFPRMSEEAAFGVPGLKASAIRVPQVHGRGSRGFVAQLIQIAREKGVSGYIGTGENRWSAVYLDDVARAYVLALESGVAGRRYHAVAEQGVPLRDIAAEIGRKLGVPVVSVPPEQAAEHFGWLAMFAGLDLVASSELTRLWLNWTPTGPGIIEDLEHGTYFA